MGSLKIQDLLHKFTNFIVKLIMKSGWGSFFHPDSRQSNVSLAHLADHLIFDGIIENPMKIDDLGVPLATRKPPDNGLNFLYELAPCALPCREILLCSAAS